MKVTRVKKFLKLTAIATCLISASSTSFAGSASQVGQVYSQPSDYGVILGVYPVNTTPGTGTPGSGNASSGVITTATNTNNDPTNPFSAVGNARLSNMAAKGLSNGGSFSNWFFVRGDVTCLNIVRNQVDPNTGESFDVAIVGGVSTGFVDNKGGLAAGTQFYTLFRSDGKTNGSTIFAAFVATPPPGPCGFVDTAFVLADLPLEFGIAPQPLSIWSALSSTTGRTVITP